MTASEISPPPSADPAGEPPLDRAISPVAGGFGAGLGSRIVVLGGLVLGCLALAGLTWRADHGRPEQPPEPPVRQVVAYEPAKPPTLAAPGPDAPSLGPGGPPPPAPAEAAAAGGLAPAHLAQNQAAQNQVGQNQAAQNQAAENRAAQARATPLLVYDQRPEPAPGTAAQAHASRETAAALNPLDSLRRSSPEATARAERLGDRSFLILAGSSLPCILQTAMDSSTPGYVSCVIPTDVYSDNGAVVLMAKGTRVLGEYRGGLRQGQARLFVLWTRAVTPDGVALALASPAADALGRAGFDGELDRHFWERFGAGLLLSVVDGGSAAIAARASPLGVVRAPSDAAGLAVEGAQEIAPTLRKPQGAEVSILAAQDFDFSGVYGLQAR